MKYQYIEFVADRFLVVLGNERYYNKMNPFDFTNSLQGKTTFFEKRVSDWAKAGISNSSTPDLTSQPSKSNHRNLCEFAGSCSNQPLDEDFQVMLSCFDGYLFGFGTLCRGYPSL